MFGRSAAPAAPQAARSPSGRAAPLEPAAAAPVWPENESKLSRVVSFGFCRGACMAGEWCLYGRRKSLRSSSPARPLPQPAAAEARSRPQQPACPAVPSPLAGPGAAGGHDMGGGGTGGGGVVAEGAGGGLGWAWGGEAATVSVNPLAVEDPLRAGANMLPHRFRRVLGGVICHTASGAIVIACGSASACWGNLWLLYPARTHSGCRRVL